MFGKIFKTLVITHFKSINTSSFYVWEIINLSYFVIIPTSKSILTLHVLNYWCFNGYTATLWFVWRLPIGNPLWSQTLFMLKVEYCFIFILFFEIEGWILRINQINYPWSIGQLMIVECEKSTLNFQCEKIKLMRDGYFNSIL